MKSLLFVTIIVCVTICVSGKRCYSVLDCEQGKCCTGGISAYIKGTCQPLGQEGDSCDPNPPVTEKYFLRCPCAGGLTCTHVNPNPNVASTPTCETN